jgi:hypothetical protein
MDFNRPRFFLVMGLDVLTEEQLPNKIY